MYGQIAAARECWGAAGYWRGLLPLNALAGDFTSISIYVRTQQQVPFLLCIGQPYTAETPQLHLDSAFLLIRVMESHSGSVLTILSQQ